MRRFIGLSVLALATACASDDDTSQDPGGGGGGAEPVVLETCDEARDYVCDVAAACGDVSNPSFQVQVSTGAGLIFTGAQHCKELLLLDACSDPTLCGQQADDVTCDGNVFTLPEACDS